MFSVWSCVDLASNEPKAPVNLTTDEHKTVELTVYEHKTYTSVVYGILELHSKSEQDSIINNNRSKRYKVNLTESMVNDCVKKYGMGIDMIAKQLFLDAEGAEREKKKNMEINRLLELFK